MHGTNVIGILFAYVHEERIRSLTENRVMASVPFGGRYRLVDFALSNMVNSGINQVGVVTEENYQSLMDHLGSGKAWDLSRKTKGLSLLPPFGAKISRTEGKVESLSTIKRFLHAATEEYVLLSDCDIVANIDYRELYDFHTKNDADITVVYRHGNSPDTDKNTVFTIDPSNVVREIYLKRGCHFDCNYGMGMYLIAKEKLIELVDDCMSRNLYDFDRDIIQRGVKDMKICAYEFTGAAYPITSFEAYFNASMALMDPKVRSQLFVPSRPVYTKVRDDMPTRYGLGSVIQNSFVADGCVVEGEVENCVLFRGVKVKKGARLKNCVIMQDTIVGENSRLDFVVADKNVEFTDNATIMGHTTYPVYIVKGSKV
ncbi:glucose-1-phosphate adenylyltransferase subunit GlgD [Scatolibacter rhodanostii]|uniref:glucose-1-phosphate adenylyltransferase subunit GlgD n=1 Tax=Scatolibacter rhodanostii TaxID=2014781 RepID=UPI000C077A51|nr:glucose-1-phosphate adenylyltransferase subunit GlgD [Scatolibacter rhodanostii]